MVHSSVESPSPTSSLSVNSRNSHLRNEVAAVALGEQLAKLVESFYVDLDAVREERGFDPVRALRGARQTSELQRVFEQLGDRHSLLHLPIEPSDQRPGVFKRAQQSGVLRLGFRLEASTDEGIWRVWVTQRDHRLRGQLAVGDEVTHWNGTPIALAAATLGRQLRGASESASRQLGLRSLSQRILGSSGVPAEDWVWVTARSGRQRRHVKLHWQSHLDSTSPHSNSQWRAPLSDSISGDGFRCGWIADPAHAGDPLSRTLYLRLFALHTWTEFQPFRHWLRQQLVSLATPISLIVDVRGNPGGEVATAEQLALMLGASATGASPQDSTGSAQQDRLVRYRYRGQGGTDALPWQTLDQRLPTVSEPLLSCASLAVIVDALTFSAAEVLTALLTQTNPLAQSIVVGTDPHTGGGIANAWCYDSMRGPDHLRRQRLPHGVDLQLAVRRIEIRTGNTWDSPRHIAADRVVALTKRDLLAGNSDLLSQVTQLLPRSGTVSERCLETQQPTSCPKSA